jgi:hypothetical protein
MQMAFVDGDVSLNRFEPQKQLPADSNLSVANVDLRVPGIKLPGRFTAC